MSINQFNQYKNKEAGILETNPQLRPKNVQKVSSVPQAEKWRSIILGEVSSKLTQINDPTTNDLRLRELNDELNKLFKEKRAWEYRIKELGGTDYIIQKNDMIHTGFNIAGWRYFGRAKELPDVKKMIEDKKKPATKKAPKRKLDDFYYGKIEDDKELQDYESERLKELLEHYNGEIKLSELPTNDQLNKWLVDKKRQQLMQKLGL
ncbi:ISY1 [Candida jiufengensis]|uniref:ISY1 n=1 Tax=Candida jiufengensis TaxID=497108 RepID=UPI0022258088|nr:ISY1 [Candida jiufengensis]KAI5949325.1 ISY1 [Candida jiufengensis]